MEKLLNLIEKRNKVGQKPGYTKGGNYDELIEYTRLGGLILEEIDQMYKSGKLKNIITLPFEIGERVFVIKKNEVIEDVVEDYDIWSLKEGVNLRIRLMNNNSYIIGIFNKTVFRTREEAEQALVRMEKENG